jgi:hypothetical protein
MAILVRGESQKPDLVADGIYPATLTAVKEFENSYGPRLGFEFTLGGEAQGQTVMRSTVPKLTAKSKLAELLKGLSGKDIDAIDIECGFDLETLVGTDCQVIVRQSQGKNGKLYSNVEGVFRQ